MSSLSPSFKLKRCSLPAIVFVAALSSCASRSSSEREPVAPPEPASTSTEGGSAPAEPEPATSAWRFEGPVLSGENCKNAELPTWVFDEARHRVSLSNDPSTALDFPRGWSAELEQPRLLVLRAPAPPEAFRPSFEFFIGPVCDQVDGPAVLARVAARAWATVREPASTFHAVQEGQWPASLGGIGRSLILEVELDSSAGSQAASLYFTDYARAETFAIYAVAACPGRVPPVATEGPCQSAYRALLE